jgi:hypothetical protein
VAITGSNRKIESAVRVFQTIDKNYTVCLNGESMTEVSIDGSYFTADHLEAIAYLLRHAPEKIQELAI